MRDSTKNFVMGWELKLSQIKDADNHLNELYDKFTTLYTIYNRLYNEAHYVLKLKNSLEKIRYSDRAKATEIVVSFLGAKSIIDKVTIEHGQRDIDSVRTLLANGIFYINTSDGKPDEATDKDLLGNLISPSSEVRSKAILSLIYNVRCNLIHGYKNFEEIQRLVIEPVANLLQKIIELLKEKFLL